jgi:hypothetical protein
MQNPREPRKNRFNALGDTRYHLKNECKALPEYSLTANLCSLQAFNLSFHARDRIINLFFHGEMIFAEFLMIAYGSRTTFSRTKFIARS